MESNIQRYTQRFFDGVTSMVSSLINARDVSQQNAIQVRRLDQATLREIYRHGIANKIIRIKAGGALKDSLQFDSKDDENYYNKRLAKKVKQTAGWMIAFGRGIIVLHMPGDDLTKPLTGVDANRVLVSVFSGDMVTPGDVDRDLQSIRYYKPLSYNVRGYAIHWTRVVDFTYIEPPELDAPGYHYGGVSEFEIIYDQLIADGVVQRASPKIIEKASTLFYKVRGFKDAMRTGDEQDMINYFSRLEDLRGIHSAGLIDAEDEVEAVQQVVSNLSDADQITLRRLAMVTGISITRLVGENVKGLNSSGDNEASMDQDMIETIQSEHLLEPINELMRKLGQGEVSFKENQGETAGDRIKYETDVINNAKGLFELGEDHAGYLLEKGVTQKDEFDQIFAPPPSGGEPNDGEPDDSDYDDDPLAIDPQSALNGAQVTSLLEIVERVRVGSLSKETAVQLMATAYPVTIDEANNLLRDVVVEELQNAES